MKSEDKFAVSALYVWFNKVKRVFLNAGAEIEFKDTGQGSARVRVETKNHLMEVAVWDHASCLDSEILDLKTEHSSFSHTGDCGSRLEFDLELQKFLSEFQANIKS